MIKCYSKKTNIKYPKLYNAIPKNTNWIGGNKHIKLPQESYSCKKCPGKSNGNG